MWRRIVLLSLVVLGGCRLNDLLNPGPPPEEEKCYANVTFRTIQEQDNDTTFFIKRMRVACPEPEP